MTSYQDNLEALSSPKEVREWLGKAQSNAVAERFDSIESLSDSARRITERVSAGTFEALRAVDRIDALGARFGKWLTTVDVGVMPDDSRQKVRELWFNVESLYRQSVLLSALAGAFVPAELAACVKWVSQWGQYWHLRAVRQLSERVSESEGALGRTIAVVVLETAPKFQWLRLLDSHLSLEERLASVKILVQLGREIHRETDTRGSFLESAAPRWPMDIERCSVATLLKLPPGELLYWSIAATAEWCGAEMIAPLLELLANSTDTSVRWRVLNAFGVIGGQQSVEPLIRVASDRNEFLAVRGAALDALLQLATAGSPGMAEDLPLPIRKWHVPRLTLPLKRLFQDENEPWRVRHQAETILNYLVPEPVSEPTQMLSHG